MKAQAYFTKDLAGSEPIIRLFDGCRNEQSLKRQGRLWFFPDMSGREQS